MGLQRLLLSDDQVAFTGEDGMEQQEQHHQQNTRTWRKEEKYWIGI